ncbi:MAG: T9SS type A sorting domain-containing protein [Bacteroidales bacterium]|nr:T9SS type A sorting domain-containing protein [Bacteroidales bacterium]
MKNNMKIKKSLLTILIIALTGMIFFPKILSAQEIINNDKLRFGNGSEQSINVTGNLQQPFYYNSTSTLWRKLTYSSYPLDNAFAVGGDGTNEWNLNGNRVDNPSMSGQVIDKTGFIYTTGDNGYGTIISTGTVNVGGVNLEVENTYELEETKSYITITSKVTNISGSSISNVRIWIGTRDDYVGGTDSPRKQKGNLIDGSFVQISSPSERAAALLIKTSDEGVLFYTNSDKGNNIIQSCCSWTNVINQDPNTSTMDVTNDGSYGFYVRMNDLANGASDEFTWYYASGELAVLDDIIEDVASASGAVSNITYTSADYTAEVSEDATGYYIVVPDGSVAPTEDQIKAGVNYTGATVVLSGSAAMTADVEHIFELTGLTVGTDYVLYFVAEDAVPQYTAIITSSFSTLQYPATEITTHPANHLNVCLASSVTFVVEADGHNLSYQWQLSGSNIGTDLPSLAVNNIEMSDMGDYTCIVTGSNGTVTSNIATLSLDAVNPTVVTQNITVNLDETGNVSIEANDIDNGSSDNCGINSISLDITDFTCANIGTNTVSLNVTDVYGNSASNTATVTVEDVTNPEIPTLADVTGECSATATAPTTTDVCAGTITGTTSDALTYSTQGTHVITWNFDDGNGNSIDVTQNVVIDDVTNPETPTLEDITAECSATATAPSTTDNCAGTITGTTTDPLTYSTQGTHVITWNFDDGNGNSIDVTQNVIVDDITAPVPDVAELPEVTDECSVTLIAPTATDNCAGTITATTNDPITYTEQDKYLVTWTYDDRNGNITTQIQNVIIEDITAPVPDVAELPEVTDECSVTLIAPTATDNCAGTITATTNDPITYTEQDKYLVTWTYDDRNGNITTQIQNVIIEDITAPVPDVAELPEVTDECSVTLIAPTATDNCAGTITATTNDPIIYTEQDKYLVTWTYDDGNGNITTQIQNVIIEDITSPKNPDLSDLTDECSITATAPTTSDNCAGTITGTTSDALTYSTQGTHVITWNFDDGNGNSINVTQNVVIDDVTNPTISCIENKIISLSKGETTYTVSGTEFDPVSTDDNCNVASVINDFNELSTLDGAIFPVGTTKIVWTVKDDAENTNTCTFKVTVNEYTDIENLRQNGISIYPNPTNGIINIETGNNNIQNIKISDITGKTLIKKSDIQQNEAIDLSEIESGIYIISIQTDKEIFTTKIIKK